jgi:hypothetical protein
MADKKLAASSVSGPAADHESESSLQKGRRCVRHTLIVAQKPSTLRLGAPFIDHKVSTS